MSGMGRIWRCGSGMVDLLVARQRGRDVALDVDVDVVRDVEHHLVDAPTGPLESGLVLGAHRIPAVIADAQSLTAQREVARLGAQWRRGHLPIVDVQLGGAMELAVLPDALLDELDAHDVTAGVWRRSRETGLGWDAQEVVGVGQGAVLDEQGVTAETRPVGEDDALR